VRTVDKKEEKLPTDREKFVKQKRKPIRQQFLGDRFCSPQQKFRRTATLHRAVNQLGQQRLQYTTTHTSSVASLTECGIQRTPHFKRLPQHLRWKNIDSEYSSHHLIIAGQIAMGIKVKRARTSER
jgi:hypothetical protein